MLVAALMLRRYRMGSLKAELAYRKNFWTQLMKTALTYDEWAHAAAMLDKYNGRKQVQFGTLSFECFYQQITKVQSRRDMWHIKTAIFRTARLCTAC